MLNFSVLRTGKAGLPASIGVAVSLAAFSLASGEARAGRHHSSYGGAYATVYYGPRYYSPPVVYVDEPWVYVERIRPRVTVRYRSYSPPYRYYWRGGTIGHGIRDLFRDGHRRRHARHGFYARWGHGHRGGHGWRHRW